MPFRAFRNHFAPALNSGSGSHLKDRNGPLIEKALTENPLE